MAALYESAVREFNSAKYGNKFFMSALGWNRKPSLMTDADTDRAPHNRVAPLKERRSRVLIVDIDSHCDAKERKVQTHIPGRVSSLTLGGPKSTLQCSQRFLKMMACGYAVPSRKHKLPATLARSSGPDAGIGCHHDELGSRRSHDK